MYKFQDKDILGVEIVDSINSSKEEETSALLTINSEGFSEIEIALSREEILFLLKEILNKESE